MSLTLGKHFQPSESMRHICNVCVMILIMLEFSKITYTALALGLEKQQSFRKSSNLGRYINLDKIWSEPHRP